MKKLICLLMIVISFYQLRAQGCVGIKFLNAFPWRQMDEVGDAHANYYTFSDSINATIEIHCEAYKSRVITLSLLIPDVSEPTGYSSTLLDTLLNLPSGSSSQTLFNVKKKLEIDSACILRIDGLDRTNLQGNNISCLLHVYKPFITVSKSNIYVRDSVVFNCGYIGPTYNDVSGERIFKDMDTSNLNSIMQSDKMQLITNNDNADFEPFFDKIYPGKLLGWFFKPKAAGKFVISYSERAFYLKQRGIDYPLNKYDTITVSTRSGLQAIDKINNFPFYPNPATDHISFDNVINFEIYDALGTMVKSGRGDYVNLSSLSQGVYIIRSINERGVQSGKLVKQ